MRISEDNIADQIRGRNEQTIGWIIDHYGGLLVAIIKSHAPFDHQECEECLDDVLLAVWNHIDSFDAGRNSFKQWIAAIARHRAIDYQRQRIRRQRRYVQWEPDERQPSETERGEPRKEDAEELLGHLNGAEREIFEKYYLEGYPTRELAQRLNVKESWIHNKLSRGRKKLKQLLKLKQEVQRDADL